MRKADLRPPHRQPAHRPAASPGAVSALARLTIAKSRIRFSIWSLVRMDQTCLAKSGGFGPINVPLFQAVRFGGIDFSFSMAVLISLQDAHDAPGGPAALLTRAITPHPNDRDPA